MNQTPNIEETHDTETEEVIKEFDEMPFGVTIPFNQDMMWGEKEGFEADGREEFKQWLRTTLHHQLQKARQDWKMASVEPVAKAIYNQMSYTEDGVKPEWVERGNSFKQDEARQLALKALDHSELDQDNKYKIN